MPASPDARLLSTVTAAWVAMAAAHFLGKTRARWTAVPLTWGVGSRKTSSPQVWPIAARCNLLTPSVIPNQSASASIHFVPVKWMTKNSSVRSAKFSTSNRLRSSSNSTCSARFIASPPTTGMSAGSTISIPLPGRKRTRPTNCGRPQNKFYEHHDNAYRQKTRLQSRRYQSGRLGSEGNFHRGKGDAGVDVDPREVRAAETPDGCARDWFAAHDDPDGGVDRNTCRSWRECALGKLQYFFDAGSRRGCDRESGRLCFRVERRIAGRILVVHLSSDLTSGRQGSATNRR